MLCLCLCCVSFAGVQWLSGRVLDSRPSQALGLEPHRLHCVEQEHYLSLVLVQPRKTRLFIAERLLIGRIEANQTKTLCVLTRRNVILLPLWDVDKKNGC